MSSPFYFDRMMEQASSTCRLIPMDYDSKTKTADENNSFIIKGFMDGNNINVGINHSFEPAGNSGLMGTIRGVYENLRPMIARHANLVSKITDAGTGALKSFGVIDNKTSSEINNVAGFIKDMGNSVVSKHLEIPDDYLFLFKGTSITVPTSMSVIMISDGDTDIYVQLKYYLNRLIGDFEAKLNGLIGVQNPPNNYMASLDALLTNVNIPGTFSLYVGDYSRGKGFRFPGLVVNAIDLDISKVFCMIAPGVYRPLMIKMNLTLMPVKKYTKNDLFKDILRS